MHLGTIIQGTTFRLEVALPETAAGPVAVAIFWPASPSSGAPSPDVFVVAPGTSETRTTLIPAAALQVVVDLDLPNSPGAVANVRFQQVGGLDFHFTLTTDARLSAIVL